MNFEIAVNQLTYYMYHVVLATKKHGRRKDRVVKQGKMANMFRFLSDLPVANLAAENHIPDAMVCSSGVKSNLLVDANDGWTRHGLCRWFCCIRQLLRLRDWYSAHASSSAWWPNQPLPESAVANAYYVSLPPDLRWALWCVRC